MLESTDLSFSLNAAVCAFELKMEFGENCSLDGLTVFLPPADHPEYYETLVELVRIDLEYRWGQGTQRSLDDYLSRFPGLLHQSTLLNAICFEEHRQKVLADHASTPEDYQSKYGVPVGSWRLSQSRPGSTNRPLNDEKDKLDGMPTVGESFLGFELISELGRGSFARVFLARETALSNRLVALKVTRNRYSDSKTLARLQHTNIIPVYSVQQHGDWEAICMPYFGSLTCNQLLNRIRHQSTIPPSGEFILDTVVEIQKTTRRGLKDSSLEKVLTDNENVQTEALEAAQGYQELKGMTYVRSILSIAHRLASGLACAHSRGIVHRDLKPANILLSDDGEPMLLDFNLSEDTSNRKESLQEFIGGTLPYMAPEQLASFGLQSRIGIDSRSDLFSFGIVLYELLAGKSPFPTRHGKLNEVIEQSIEDRFKSYPSLRSHSSTISPAVDSIIAKCLAPQLEDRYQSAQQLCEDLERQLDNRTLAHAPEPSIKERCEKWIRRHPRIVSASSISVVAAMLLIAVLSVLAIRSERLASLESRELWQVFQEKRRVAESHLTSAPLGDAEAIDAAIFACDSAMRVFPVDEMKVGNSSTTLARLSNFQRNELARDVGELLFLKATSLGLRADFANNSDERMQLIKTALELNQQASKQCSDEQFARSLSRQSHWLRGDQLGDEATNTEVSPSEMSVRTLAEQACLLSAQRRFAEAAEFWNKALLQDPKNLWLWHGLGYSLEQTSDLGRAAECYSACIALQPENYLWYFQRGVIRIKTGEFHLAELDLAKAIEMEPEHADCYLNRGIALLELKMYGTAQEAIDKAFQLGFKDPQAYRLLHQIHQCVGDQSAAADALTQAENTIPISAQSWVARAVSKARRQPEEAIADLNVAVSLNAHLLPALESKASILSEILQRPDEAITVLDEAVRLFPEAYEMLAVRGVLHARLQHHQQALADANACLSASNAPEIKYRVAGIFALLSSESPEFAGQSLRLIASSLQVGYGLDLLETDPDLDAIRKLPEFERLRASAINFETMSLK